MNKFNQVLILGFALATPAGGNSAPNAESDVFAVRGLPVGISMKEFRKFPIVNDYGNTDLQTWCSYDTNPNRKKIYVNEDDQKIGVVECKWYSRRPDVAWMSVDDHWIDLGKGKGSPVFRFIDDGTGLKLFQIQFYANSEYYQGIYDALSIKYGKSADATSTFKTRSGVEFVSKTSTWKNSGSSIVLKFRCRHVERYCLNFNHSALTKVYQDKKAVVDSEAASKI